VPQSAAQTRGCGEPRARRPCACRVGGARRRRCACENAKGTQHTQGSSLAGPSLTGARTASCECSGSRCCVAGPSGTEVLEPL
jgi:hypothetical protein